MSIALSTLGAHYLDLANAVGISPELLHRVAVMSSGSFDSLPHNGAVITLLSICRLTHRHILLRYFHGFRGHPGERSGRRHHSGNDVWQFLSLACRPRPRAAVPIK